MMGKDQSDFIPFMRARLIISLGVLIFAASFSGCIGKPGVNVDSQTNIPPPEKFQVAPTTVAPLSSSHAGGIYAFDPAFGYFFIDTLEFDISLLSSTTDNNDGPGQATYVDFSPEGEYVAYWIPGSPGKIVLAKIDLSEKTIVFVDSELVIDKHPLINFIWSPDSKFLIVEIIGDESSNLLFHVETKTLTKNWGFACNFVKVSITVFSSEVALGCENRNGDNFALIDANGYISYQSNTSDDYKVGRIPIDLGFYPNWSIADSNHVLAFFEETDNFLSIFDFSQAGQIQIEPISSIYPYWVSPLYNGRLILLDFPFEWSQNARRLLVYGVGNTPIDCPNELVIDGPNSGIYTPSPCWMVFDRDQERVIWHLNELMISNIGPYSPLAFHQAALSPNGEFLALAYGSVQGSGTVIIDLNSSEVTRKLSVFALVMKWSAINPIDK